MTKKDFFVVMIKLFGLLSLVNSVFSAIPGNISFALMEIDLTGILWITIAVIIIGGLFVLLVFKADKVVNILKLDRGFDDNRIELKDIKATDIIKLGTFIIGGLLIIENVPGFLSHTLFAFKEDVVGLEYKTEDKFQWTVSGLNLLIGYLLLTNYSFISKRLNNNSEDNAH